MVTLRSTNFTNYILITIKIKVNKIYKLTSTAPFSPELFTVAPNHWPDLLSIAAPVLALLFPETIKMSFILLLTIKIYYPNQSPSKSNLLQFGPKLISYKRKLGGENVGGLLRDKTENFVLLI